MNASKPNNTSLSEKITLNTTELMDVLSCGRATAVHIGQLAEARIQIGKRVLWNTKKIQSYINSISY